MEIQIGISNRHIHLTKDHLEILFGKDYELTFLKKLSQIGQYACQETVTIKTLKNSFDKVRIIGPLRDYTQVEISKTDSYFLGISPPIRNSGELENSETITIVGPNGELELKECCIIATRHIHISKTDIEKYNIKSNKVSVLIQTEKGAILNEVYIKEEVEGITELHLDTDDANACLINKNTIAKII